MRKLGLSTGCFYRFLDAVSQEVVDRIKALGADAIEINAYRPHLLDAVFDLDLSAFSYRSMHLPSNIRYDDSEEIKVLITNLQRLHKKHAFDALVLHPDRVDAWDIFDGLPIAIENMDDNKKSFRFPDELQMVFDKTSFNFVLDVQHGFCNDDSFALTEEFAKRFSSRLVEVHASTFKSNGEDKQSHYLFSDTPGQDGILDSIPPVVTVILEGSFLSSDQVEKEFSYVKERLR